MSEPLAQTPDEGSEADRSEQQVPAAVDLDDVDAPGGVAGTFDALRVVDVEASEGDVIEQAQPVPLDGEDDRA